jgi:hypothetical protein
MATRAVLQAFERYQKERVAFVSAVAEMAKSPQVSWNGRRAEPPATAAGVTVAPRCCGLRHPSLLASR